MGQDASAILEARTAAIRIAQNSKADHTKRDHSARAQEPNAMNPTVSMKKMANSAMGAPLWFGALTLLRFECRWFGRSLRSLLSDKYRRCVLGE
jgi:hypothetical protein